MKKLILLLMMVWFALNSTSCMKLPQNIFESVYRSLFSNDGVICKAPGVNFLSVNVLGICRVENTNPTLDPVNNWNIGADIVLQTAKGSPAVSVSPVCYDTAAAGTNADFNCETPKMFFDDENGNTFSIPIDPDGPDDLGVLKSNEVFSINDGEAFDRTYKLTAYCDENQNNVFDGDEALYQTTPAESATIILKYTPDIDGTVENEGKIEFDQSSSVPITTQNECHPTAAEREEMERLREIERLSELERLRQLQERNSADPLVIDIFGNGFKFERSRKEFDYIPGGIKELWYGVKADNNDDAFLVLDINRNGTIDNGSELFGNYTAFYLSPTSDTIRNFQNGTIKPEDYKFYRFPFKRLPEHGFEALSVYDRKENGGNENGWIDGGDIIYPFLKLWVQDLNENNNHHNILSDKVPISSFGIEIKLSYIEMKEVDPGTGNQTRFRSIVKFSKSPMSLKDTKTGHIYEVYETVIADIFFRVLDPETANLTY